MNAKLVGIAEIAEGRGRSLSAISAFSAIPALRHHC
jgi:hypothetical protein